MNAIWAIIGGFAATFVVSAGMLTIILTHPPRSAPHKTIPPPCACKGQCMRKAGAQ